MTIKPSDPVTKAREVVSKIPATTMAFPNEDFAAYFGLAARALRVLCGEDVEWLARVIFDGMPTGGHGYTSEMREHWTEAELCARAVIAAILSRASDTEIRGE